MNRGRQHREGQRCVHSFTKYQNTMCVKNGDSVGMEQHKTTLPEEQKRSKMLYYWYSKTKIW